MHSYTVTNRTDAALAGIPAKLVLEFIEGSSIEVTLEQVTQLVKPCKEAVEYRYHEALNRYVKVKG